MPKYRICKISGFLHVSSLSEIYLNSAPWFPKWVYLYLISGLFDYTRILKICVFVFQDGDYVMEKEYEGRGLCPYDPDHNSTAVYSGA